MVIFLDLKVLLARRDKTRHIFLPASFMFKNRPVYVL
jgi:hypothetical protein